MTLTAILILIFLGVILILIEFLVLPGTNIAGVIGLLLIIGSIFFSYRDIGTPTAHFILGGAFLFLVASITFAIRSNTWKKMSLKTSIDGKVENIEKDTVAIGDKGITISRLAPIGKAMVNNIVFEAKSNHKFLDQNTPIEVINIVGNQIIIKPLE